MRGCPLNDRQCTYARVLPYSAPPRVSLCLYAQLYRVNVLLQPPGSTPQAASTRPPFFVLRRYNQFRLLYDQVRRQQASCSHAAALCQPVGHQSSPAGTECRDLSSSPLQGTGQAHSELLVLWPACIVPQLKQALPDVMKDRALAPPPRHALHIRGSKVHTPTRNTQFVSARKHTRPCARQLLTCGVPVN